MQNNLINWYKENHRDFPWRKTKDPYAIWISEIMLQQTTTEAVIPYYTRFIEKFPTVKNLADANEEEVYKYWEGLGYYRRAKHLHLSAQIIVEKYHGLFPTHYQDVLALKGVGLYTAGAICSIAYGMQIPAVDGNVLRIIARQYAIQDNIALSKTQKDIYQIVEKLIHNHDASSFNQGLMDLGATICRPKNPLCHQCPILSTCKAYKHHEEMILPINIKNIKHKDMHFITGIITYKNQFLLIQNPSGLLENLYGFIQYDCESPFRFIEEFEKEYHASLTIISHIEDIKHVFTHRTWYMHVYHFILDKPIESLYTLQQIQEKPLSTAHLKVLKVYLK